MPSLGQPVARNVVYRMYEYERGIAVAVVGPCGALDLVSSLHGKSSYLRHGYVYIPRPQIKIVGAQKTVAVLHNFENARNSFLGDGLFFSAVLNRAVRFGNGNFRQQLTYAFARKSRGRDKGVGRIEYDSLLGRSAPARALHGLFQSLLNVYNPSGENVLGFVCGAGYALLRGNRAKVGKRHCHQAFVGVFGIQSNYLLKIKIVSEKGKPFRLFCPYYLTNRTNFCYCLNNNILLGFAG